VPLQSSEWFSNKGVECSRVMAKNDAFPRHLHDEYVISANLRGTEEIWMDGKYAQVGAGQVTVYNPATVQSSLFGNDGVEFVSIHLPQSILKDLVVRQNLRNSNQPPTLKEGVLGNRLLFNAIRRFAHKAKAEDAEDQEQELLLLCGALLEDFVPRDSNGDQAVRQVKCYLAENLTIKPQLDTLALLCGLSKYHLIRRFTQLIGMPPLQYHMQLRLQRARDLLRDNVHPLDAALALGFYDQSHFINSFRRMMGVTPYHYVRQLNLGSNKFPITRGNHIKREIAKY